MYIDPTKDRIFSSRKPSFNLSVAKVLHISIGIYIYRVEFGLSIGFYLTSLLTKSLRKFYKKNIIWAGTKFIVICYFQGWDGPGVDGEKSVQGEVHGAPGGC